MSDEEQQATSGRRGWRAVLLRRWPTVCGIALALLTTLSGQLDRAFTDFLSVLLVFMALIYLGAALLGRRSSAWLLFGVGLVVVTVLRFLGWNGVAVALLLLVALVFLLLGALRRRWCESGLLLETLGMVAFSAVALGVMNANLTWAGYLAALGLFSHAAWDAVHLWRKRVVAGSYAEFCAVLDVALGVTILVMM